MNRSLTILVHGNGKVGKTTFAMTAPGPRLLLDTEAEGYRFLPNNFIDWDPLTQAPPVPDGTWDTAVVKVDEYRKFLKAMDYMETGKHQFRSVILDSVSELQDKLYTKITGSTVDALKQQQWGDMLRQMTSALRALRDIAAHETNPLEVVVIIAASKENQNGQNVPTLQGSSANVLPYLYDINAALTVTSKRNPDPTMPKIKTRRLFLEETDEWYAGERVQGRLGVVIENPHLDIEKWRSVLFPEPTPPAADVPATPTDSE